MSKSKKRRIRISKKPPRRKSSRWFNRLNGMINLANKNYVDPALKVTPTQVKP